MTVGERLPISALEIACRYSSAGSCLRSRSFPETSCGFRAGTAASRSRTTVRAHTEQLTASSPGASGHLRRQRDVPHTFEHSVLAAAVAAKPF